MCQLIYTLKEKWFKIIYNDLVALYILILAYLSSNTITIYLIIINILHNLRLSNF